MSGKRRVKDVHYEDDTYDDGFAEQDEETQELSPEDQEQMRIGTIQVRQALVDTPHVSDKAIQEALWHYYYDVGKSVAYLQDQHQKSQTPKKTKGSSLLFDQAASIAAKKVSGGFNPIFLSCNANTMRHHRGRDSKSKTLHESGPPVEWFKDVSWSHIPSHQRGIGIIEHGRPALRMLGGSSTSSGKISKLAALAAARKQKETRKPEDKDVPSDALLTRLGNKRPAADEQAARPAPSELSSSSRSTGQSSYSIRTTSPAALELVSHKSSSAEAQKPSRAQPSVFAQVLCQSSSGPQTHPTSSITDALASVFFGDLSITRVANALSGPSPDDVVTSAQAKGFKKQEIATKATKSAKPAAVATSRIAVDGVARDVASLGVSEVSSPKTKRKRINVAEEYEMSIAKSEASFVVVGHVDHGKSTLMGRLLCDLKVVDQRSIDRYRSEASKMGKASFALAWVMDSTSEERERGVTVDVATNGFETSKIKFTILDAPGHRDFVPNMIAGASQADFAVLVIDAGTNGFEAGLRGQTREHALLVRSSGVQRIVIAVNKMDAANWSEERFEEIKQQMTAFLVAAGFKAERLSFVPCAGLTGENVVSGPPPAAANWYSGDTLVQALERFEPVKAQINQRFRMSISDVFRGGITHPLSVSGKIDTGSIQLEDTVLCMPANETASVKAIEFDGTAAAEYAVAGRIATLHLSDVDPVHLHVGDVLCDPGKPVKNTARVTAKVLAFEHMLPMPVDVHRGRLHVPGRIARLEATLDKTSGAVVKKRPKVVQPGSVARIRVELDALAPLEAPVRIVLRADGVTIAAGLIESTS